VSFEHLAKLKGQINIIFLESAHWSFSIVPHGANGMMVLFGRNFSLK